VKVLVIYNPASGALGRRSRPAAIQRFLTEKGVQWRWHTTSAGGTAAACRRLFDDSLDRIIVVGGDGTIREVAQELIDRDMSLPLAIVPQGSGNVLAKTLGIPRLSLKRALAVALGDERVPLDVLRINRRYVALVGAGQGYDVVLMGHVTRTLKRCLGFGAYVLSFLRSFARAGVNGYVVTVDGKRMYLSASIVVALNAFSPGKFLVDHVISPHDGCVNVFAVRARSAWDVFRQALRCLSRRTGLPPGVTVFTARRRISIRQRHSSRIQFDGDVMKGKSLTIDILPRKLVFIVPRKRA